MRRQTKKMPRKIMTDLNHQRGAQGKHAAAKKTVRFSQENVVSQNYLDTCLKAYTRDHHFRVGETRQGELTMVEEDEKFEFLETTSERWTRNPKVWEGKYINIHRDKQGHYQIHLRKLEMGKRFNAIRVATAIGTELLTAQKVLGL